MIGKINSLLISLFGIEVRRITRHSTKFVKEYFNKDPIDIIEIGSYKGENALNILKNLNVRNIYLIDPWEEYKDYTDSEKNKSQFNLNKSFISCMKRLRNYKNIHYIKEFSDNAIDKVPKSDFIYIDGNHEYKYVKKDIDNYYSKLKDKGIIAGHDINWKNYNSVLKAVREFSEKRNLKVFYSGSDWWIIKGDKFRKKEIEDDPKEKN